MFLHLCWTTRPWGQWKTLKNSHCCHGTKWYETPSVSSWYIFPVSGKIPRRSVSITSVAWCAVVKVLSSKVRYFPRSRLSLQSVDWEQDNDFISGTRLWQVNTVQYFFSVPDRKNTQLIHEHLICLNIKQTRVCAIQYKQKMCFFLILEITNNNDLTKHMVTLYHKHA